MLKKILRYLYFVFYVYKLLLIARCHSFNVEVDLIAFRYDVFNLSYSRFLRFYNKL